MNLKFLVLITMMAIGLQLAQCQSDSTTTSYRLGLMGRWQTGNLDQVSVMPNGELNLHSGNSDLRIRANYHYLKVEGFTAIDDLWGNVLYCRHIGSRWDAALLVNAGYAESYRFDRSLLAGPGLGLHLHRPISTKKLSVYAFAGYLDFKFEGSRPVSDLGLGSLIIGEFKLASQLILNWELSTYHAAGNTSFWGGGNQLQILAQILPGLAITVTHQTYYNRQAPEGIANTNTQLLFGIQFFNLIN